MPSDDTIVDAFELREIFDPIVIFEFNEILEDLSVFYNDFYPTNGLY